MMNNSSVEVKQQFTIAKLVQDKGFIERAENVLKEGTSAFLSSVLSLANSDLALQNLDPVKLYNTCLMAAALKLPFNKNLGQAYVIAYKGEPQLQIGWKGFVQLAQRSGLFRTINVTDVREGEIEAFDRLSGEMKFNWIADEAEREKAKIIGYIAYFKLLNGFEKLLYMTVNELGKHAKKYSQTFKIGKGVWVDDFDAMSKKTVIKLLLSKYAPLSVDSDLARAIEIDQSDDEGNYADNKPRVQITSTAMGTSEEDKSVTKE